MFQDTNQPMPEHCAIVKEQQTLTYKCDFSLRNLHKCKDKAAILYTLGSPQTGPQHGNTGCGVFKWKVQNQKGFCLRINILKGNYSILRIGLVGASEVFKNQSFKSQLFSSSQKEKYLKQKSWLNFNSIIVFY